MSAVRARLADGRLHFQHGPIDLVIDVDAEPAVARVAVERAWRRFDRLLAELAGELPLLRRCAEPQAPPGGPVARRMHAAVLAYRPAFVTPMAAVAGAVADEIMGCLRGPGVRRASVNNGGDIALHLAPGAADYAVGVAIDRRGDHAGDGRRASLGPPDAPAAPAVLARPFATSFGWPASARPELPAALRIRAADPWRGIATSGWRGRSLSLGIADSVTVVAQDGARADAAATMIANAVDVPHPSIRRAPAATLRDDSDLGRRLATVAVPPLPDDALTRALDAGEAFAQACVADGRIGAALIALQGRWRAVGALAPAPSCPACVALPA